MFQGFTARCTSCSQHSNTVLLFPSIVAGSFLPVDEDTNSLVKLTSCSPPSRGKTTGHISSRCSHLHGFALKCFSPFLSILVCLFQVQFRYYPHEIHTNFIFLMFATLLVNLCYRTYYYLTNLTMFLWLF